MSKTTGIQFLKQITVPIFSSLYEGRGQIIVLHRIIPESKKQRLRNTGIEITEEHLEQLILFFKKRNYDFITLDELPDYLAGKGKSKFVIFTLDDGYVDNLIYAYPIFKKHKVPFTIYVTTNFLDKKAILWWYLLEDLLLSEDHIAFSFDEENISCKLLSYSDKEKAFSYLRHLIKSKAGSDQLNLIKTLFSAYSMPLYDKVETLAMDWNQIAQLSADSLVTIAAHTVTHPSFKALSSDQVIYEVEESITILESKLNTTISHFAYPYGSPIEVGEREINLLSKTKIKTATTGRKGNIMAEHRNHLHALPRLYIGPETTERYLVNFINGRIPFIKGAKHRIVTL